MDIGRRLQRSLSSLQFITLCIVAVYSATISSYPSYLSVNVRI